LRAPPRAEVWLVDLGLAAKVRPCLVLSVPPKESERAIITLVPHTTTLRGSRFDVAVNVRFLKPGAFDAQGLVTVPGDWLIRRVGILTPAQMVRIESAVCDWLGIQLTPTE
jgi:mRNA interferase MazF